MNRQTTFVLGACLGAIGGILLVMTDHGTIWTVFKCIVGLYFVLIAALTDQAVERRNKKLGAKQP